MFDLISSECQTLESFVYEGRHKIGLGDPTYAPSNNEDKFPSLKYIKADFCRYISLNESELTLMAELEDFKKYLSTKCPNLENPIQIDLKKWEMQPLGPHAYHNVTFESK